MRRNLLNREGRVAQAGRTVGTMVLRERLELNG